jgi:hypothetical protein
LNWNFLGLAMVLALVLAGTGCSGINASQSVSPLDFFLPGAGHFLKADPPTTNSPCGLPDNSTQIASVN